MRIDFEASDEARAALAAVGRTEDLLLSPDGTRLAIAGFAESKVLLLETDPSERSVRFGRALLVHCDGFKSPHGLAWLDDETLIVANRAGRAPILRIPRRANAAEVTIEPAATLGELGVDLIATPGSVAARQLSDGISEVLVCNNFAHTLTRHLIDREHGCTILASDVVARQGLDVPDGVTYSHSGRWVAVSNHNDRSVFIYEANRLGREDKPVGALRGMEYPHGLRFTPDDRAILVADAGTPFVRVYAQPQADWTGTHQPVDSIEVIEPRAFKRGHKNPEEGGPKGLVLTADGRVLCVTCEEEPLAIYELSERLTKLGLMPYGPRPLPEAGDALAILRVALANARRAMAEQDWDHPDALRIVEAELEAMRSSKSWRLTYPLREAMRLLRRG
jgi:sugar lactone lactonase YvrE